MPKKNRGKVAKPSRELQMLAIYAVYDPEAAALFDQVNAGEVNLDWAIKKMKKKHGK